MSAEQTWLLSSGSIKTATVLTTIVPGVREFVAPLSGQFDSSDFCEACNAAEVLTGKYIQVEVLAGQLISDTSHGEMYFNLDGDNPYELQVTATGWTIGFGGMALCLACSTEQHPWVVALASLIKTAEVSA